MSQTGNTDREDGERIPHLDPHRCLDLIAGLLPEEEQERALLHLAECPGCEEFVRARIAEREHLRATITLRTLPGGELVLDRLAAIEPDRAGRSARGVRGLWVGLREAFQVPVLRLTAAAVAVTVLLAVLFWPTPEETPPDQLLRWLPASFEETRFRAAVGQTGSEDLLAGLEAYANQDLVRARELLGAARASGQMETVRRIYLGSALAWSREYPEAVAALKGVAVRALPDPWGSEARWTLYIALRESNQRAAADSLLGVLSREVGEIGERARSVRGR